MRGDQEKAGWQAKSGPGSTRMDVHGSGRFPTPVHVPSLANQPVSGSGSVNATWVPLGGRGFPQRPANGGGDGRRGHRRYNTVTIAVSLTLTLAGLILVLAVTAAHGGL